jgi:hypothetical protein
VLLQCSGVLISVTWWTPRRRGGGGGIINPWG